MDNLTIDLETCSAFWTYTQRKNVTKYTLCDSICINISRKKKKLKTYKINIYYLSKLYFVLEVDNILVFSHKYDIVIDTINYIMLV